MEKLETLKTFPSHLSESDLKEKKGLALFFAERVVCEADMIWDEKGWTATDVEEMLHTKMRKTNNSKTESFDLFNPQLNAKPQTVRYYYINLHNKTSGSLTKADAVNMAVKETLPVFKTNGEKYSIFAEKTLGLKKGNDDFLHIEAMLLIDLNERSRGIYNATNPNEIERITDNINTLLN